MSRVSTVVYKIDTGKLPLGKSSHGAFGLRPLRSRSRSQELRTHPNLAWPLLNYSSAPSNVCLGLERGKALELVTRALVSLTHSGPAISCITSCNVWALGSSPLGSTFQECWEDFKKTGPVID